MFKKIKEFFFGKPAVNEAPIESVPYKVPEPAATTPIPLVVEVAPAPADLFVDTAPAEIIPAGIEATVAVPAKKPRKPRAPKAPAAAKKPAARSVKSKKV